MGNICGCIRADKEEQCLDPSKAPLSPVIQSSGRKFFRRKSRRKQTEDERRPQKIKENEGQIRIKQHISKEETTHPRHMTLGKSGVQKPLGESIDLLASTEVTFDPIQVKPLKDTNCDSFGSTSNRRTSKSIEKEAQLTEERSLGNDSFDSGIQGKEYFHDWITEELTFPENSYVFQFGRECSSNSHFGRPCEENASTRTPSGPANVVLEWKNNEILHQLDLQNQNQLHQGFLSFPEANAGVSILPNRSKVNVMQ